MKKQINNARLNPTALPFSEGRYLSAESSGIHDPPHYKGVSKIHTDTLTPYNQII